MFGRGKAKTAQAQTVLHSHVELNPDALERYRMELDEAKERVPGLAPAFSADAYDHPTVKDVFIAASANIYIEEMPNRFCRKPTVRPGERTIDDLITTLGCDEDRGQQIRDRNYLRVRELPSIKDFQHFFGTLTAGLKADSRLTASDVDDFKHIAWVLKSLPCTLMMIEGLEKGKTLDPKSALALRDVLAYLHDIAIGSDDSDHVNETSAAEDAQGRRFREMVRPEDRENPNSDAAEYYTVALQRLSELCKIYKISLEPRTR